jgi:hypothetical protein
VAAKTASAILTSPAAEIDLTDDTLAEERPRPFAHAADEFMPRHAAKTHVAFKNLQVRGADAGEVNTN